MLSDIIDSTILVFDIAERNIKWNKQEFKKDKEIVTF
jgi:hypothetical protein